MLCSARKYDVTSGRGRPRPATKAACSCEALEGRQLLSGGLGGLGGFFGGSLSRPEMAEVGSWRQDGMLGGGSLGLGGGMRNPLILLTSPLIVGTGGTTTPPSPSVFSSSGVQSALQTLQTDLKNDIPADAQPTHASVGALEDTMDAIRKGTLTGTAAQTQIQSDQAAILSSMGLTQAQITQIQSDQTALQTAITTASSSSTSSTSTSTTGSSSASGSSSAVQTALQTLRTDLNNDTPSGAQATHASVGQVEDDLDAIRKGTLTGSAAVTQVQTDAAAVLSSMGLTQTQISQIQAEQTALATAIQSSTTASTTSTSTTSTSSSSTSIAAVQSTLQSVSAYLAGLPGLGGFGVRSMNNWGSGPGMRGGFGPSFGFGR